MGLLDADFEESFKVEFIKDVTNEAFCTFPQAIYIDGDGRYDSLAQAIINTALMTPAVNFHEIFMRKIINLLKNCGWWLPFDECYEMPIARKEASLRRIKLLGSEKRIYDGFNFYWGDEHIFSISADHPVFHAGETGEVFKIKLNNGNIE